MRRIVYFAAGVWGVFALLMAVQTYVAMITHGHSFLRIILYNLAVWAIWVAFTPGIALLARRFPLDAHGWRNVLLHLMFGVIASALHVALWTVLTITVQPYDGMTNLEFGPSFTVAAMARVPVEVIIYLGTVAAVYALELRERSTRLETSLAQARLHALELQLQPHFLFNTLHAIGSLVRNKRDTDAIEMITGLSDLLRYTLEHAGEQHVALEQEAAILGRYLEIQQVRFADRLSIRIDVPAEVRRAAVPVLLLQPLAENAIRHGIAPSASAGRVEVQARRAGGRLLIEIFNSGRLSPGSPRGIGVRNTEERLRQLYGDEQTFALTQTEDGVLAALSIPWSEVR
jgi:two-component system LytT family sensor kinase